jgi:hypothetical protein
MDKPCMYRISVEGELGSSWSDRLGGMDITVEQREREGEQPVTVLLGLLLDQAALAGVLEALYELHLPVLSVQAIDHDK